MFVDQSGSSSKNKNTLPPNCVKLSARRRYFGMYSWRRLTISTSGTSSLLHTSADKRKTVFNNNIVKSTWINLENGFVGKQQVWMRCRDSRVNLSAMQYLKLCVLVYVAGRLLSVFSMAAADRIDSSLPADRAICGGMHPRHSHYVLVHLTVCAPSHLRRTYLLLHAQYRS